jgi:two-component system sensor histidine kinase TctE
VDGSGLGLAIVREIAQRHEAEIVVEDAQPRAMPPALPGTRFTLRFHTDPGPSSASPQV